MKVLGLTTSQWAYLAAWYGRVKGDPGPGSLSSALDVKLHWDMRYDHEPLEAGLILRHEKMEFNFTWAKDMMEDVEKSTETFRNKVQGTLSDIARLRSQL